MTETPQYDATLGGTQDLPQTITVARFTAARAKEIQAMRNSLANKNSGVKLAFQKLPKHMRRRVMSHNAKRLPRRLREIHMNQLQKSGMPPKGKRPSRKYRRKPYNLLKEYTRRQSRIRWLDTHIWHAKRFRMIEKWGYKLPLRPCDRAYRACYRATAQHCLLQDISYYRCIEVEGNFSSINEGFKSLTYASCGLSIGAKAFVRGNKEGQVTLFTNKVPKKAIGVVNFLWEPLYNDSVKCRKLWLWVHASFYCETLELIISTFGAKLVTMSEETARIYRNSACTITIIELDRELSRFRLTGPLANSIIRNAFKSFEFEKNDVKWLRNFENKTSGALSGLNNIWNEVRSLNSVDELSPHSVISININDPRFNHPKTRTKSVQEFAVTKYCDLRNYLPLSALWDTETRKAVKDSKMTQKEITDLRSALLVPGSDLEVKYTAVPLLLVQRPGSRTVRGFASGWDIIIPPGWAQPVWMSLILWGARAGGLRESEATVFELRQPNILYPDTEAGMEEERVISEDHKKTYFGKPPNKRTNYAKFAIASPLDWPWKLLLKDWTLKDSSNFFVLRERELLRKLQDLLMTKNQVFDLSLFAQPALIPVEIKMSKKGTPRRFAVICLPKAIDYAREPIEAKRGDANQEKRKEIRGNHKKLLKRLRKRRIRAKQKGKVLPIDKEMLLEYTQNMRNLWLPKPSNVRNSCSREVIGFVRDGDFCLSLGYGRAIGYIAAAALPSLFSQSQRSTVLVRNTNSRQYRLGTLSVLYD